MSKITVTDILQKKGKQKIVCLTAYDYPLASILDSAGVDLILVGDTLGMVVYGEDSTKKVTMEMMLRHTEAVRKGVSSALLAADMPIHSYDTPEDAVRNARRLCNAGAEAVKIEGDQEIADIFTALREVQIPVIGHLGLLPQKSDEYKVQGKTRADAEKILESAKILSQSGIFSIVLECIPALLAKLITEQVSVPTVGIGAGKDTDGQILVTYDLIGLTRGAVPRFARQFTNIEKHISHAVENYKQSIQEETFPSQAESFKINQEDLPKG